MMNVRDLIKHLENLAETEGDDLTVFVRLDVQDPLYSDPRLLWNDFEKTESVRGVVLVGK